MDHVTINFSEHKEVLKLKKIIPGKNAFPVLRNVRLVCKNQVFSIFATNLVTSAAYKFPVESLSDFDILVNADFFFNVIRNHKKSEISISFDGTILFFISEDIVYSYTLDTLVEQFPVNLFPSHPDLSIPEIDYPVFIEKFSNAIPGASRSLLRPVFNSVYIAVNDSNDSFIVSTDGKIVYEELIGFDISPTIKNVIIPASLIDRFLSFKKLNAPVKLYCIEKRIMLSCGFLTLSDSVVEGKFPDYRKAFNMKGNIKYNNIKLANTTLLPILKAMVKFVPEDSQKVRLTFEYNGVDIDTINKNEGFNTTRSLSIKNNQHRPIKVAFNIRNLIKGLNMFAASDDIVMCFYHKKDSKFITVPVILCCNNDNVNKRVLIMPLRLDLSNDEY